MPNPLETLIKLAQIPGISIAITSPAGGIVTQAAGVTNKAAPQAVTDTTVFEAASLSKPVFAYLLIKMAERGEFDLDKPLHEYVPDFGPPEMRDDSNYKALTARIILSHQAGLPNEFDLSRGIPFEYVSPVGQQFDYSGEAFRFLQEVLEKKIAPKTLEDLTKEELTKIGMTHTSFMPPTGCSLIKLADDESPPTPENLDGLLKNQVGIIYTNNKLFVAETINGTLQITEKALGHGELEDAQIERMKTSIKSMPLSRFSRPAEAHELPLITSILGHKSKDCAESMAVGHTDNGEASAAQHFYGVHAAGSLYTTAADYAIFLQRCVTDDYVRTIMFDDRVVPSLAGKDTKAIRAGVTPEVLRQLAWGVGIGLQKNPDGSYVAFHWGDNHTGRNFAAVNSKTKQAVVCLTNSANGPFVFQNIAEPVVGPLTPVCQWLSAREGLHINATAMHRSAMTSIRASEAAATPGPSETTPRLG